MTLVQLFQRQHEMTTEVYERRFRQEIQPIYRQSFAEIDSNLEKTFARLATVSPEDRYNEVLKFGRYRSLMQATEQSYNEASRRAGRVIRATDEAVFANSFYMRQFAYDLVIPQGLRSINILPQALIDLAVFGIPDEWEKLTTREKQRITDTFGDVANYSPQYGTLQSVLLADNQRQLNSIKRTITQAFIQGQSYPRASRALRQVFSTSASNAMRILRTEGNRLANGANFATVQSVKAQGVGIVRQWDATLDTRTREGHARLDGQKEDKNGYFTIDGMKARYPGTFGIASQDINCRCGVVDVVEGISPEVRTARDPNTGENIRISSATFDDWAKSYDLHYVNGILRPRG